MITPIFCPTNGSTYLPGTLGNKLLVSQTGAQSAKKSLELTPVGKSVNHVNLLFENRVR